MFIFLLMELAAYKDHDFWIDGEYITLKRGQLAISYRNLADKCGWRGNKGKDRVARNIKRLSKQGFLTTEPATGRPTGTSLITICDYDGIVAHALPHATESATAESAQARQSELKAATQHNKKRNKEEKNDSIKSSRLPKDWELPQEWGEWALEQGIERDEVLKEEDRFRDYWNSQPGSKGIKADWQATWRNWIRNYCERKAA